MKIDQAPAKTQPVQGFWEWAFGGTDSTGAAG
jgi:hypothetical protein